MMMMEDPYFYRDFILGCLAILGIIAVIIYFKEG